LYGQAYAAAEEGVRDESSHKADTFDSLDAAQVLLVNTIKAWLIGFGIFLYFGITTAWLPSKLITGPLASSNRIVQDLGTLAVWGFFLIAGMIGLRTAQRRGLI